MEDKSRIRPNVTYRFLAYPSSEHAHTSTSSFSWCYHHATGGAVMRRPRMSWLSRRAEPTHVGEGEHRRRAAVSRAGIREAAPARADVHKHRRRA